MYNTQGNYLAEVCVTYTLTKERDGCCGRSVPRGCPPADPALPLPAHPRCLVSDSSHRRGVTRPPGSVLARLTTSRWCALTWQQGADTERQERSDCRSIRWPDMLSVCTEQVLTRGPGPSAPNGKSRRWEPGPLSAENWFRCVCWWCCEL